MLTLRKSLGDTSSKPQLNVSEATVIWLIKNLVRYITFFQSKDLTSDLCVYILRTEQGRNVSESH
jgi:hypothetical protein